MATLAEIMDALASQIQTQLDPVIENLQVDGRLIYNPTPPAIDIYPAEEFMERLAMSSEWGFTLSIRARVSTADHEAGQDTLLSLMDPAAATSLTRAIEADETLGGVVDDVTVVGGPSGFGYFTDPGLIENRLLGALWRVQVIP
jgi:hypothetical protein